MQSTIQAISGAIGTAVMTTIMTTQTSLFMSTAEKGQTASDGLLYGINSAFIGATTFGVIAFVMMLLLAYNIHKQSKILALSE